jgi:nucleoside-diphosphate-sugar epimerase
MRILAIGATGFIGRHAVRWLTEAGHEVTVFHRGNAAVGAAARSIVGDRRKLAEYARELRAVGADTVVDFLLVNAQQAGELVAVFGGYAGRVVMLSSCDVYRAAGIVHGTEPGEPDNTPITEESMLRTNLHPYPPEAVQMLRGVFPWLEDDYDKIPAERVVMSARDLPGTVLRLPMVYGPGDPLHRSYPVVKRVDDGRAAMVLDEGTAQWRGIRGYVEDVAWAVALAAVDARAGGRVYNVGDAENFSELEWRQHTSAAAGWRGRFVVLPGDRAPAHVKAKGNLRQHWVVDTARIRRELGYREPVARGEALRRTIEWERANPPSQVTAAEYDYAAEDRALEGAG